MKEERNISTPKVHYSPHFRSYPFSIRVNASLAGLALSEAGSLPDSTRELQILILTEVPRAYGSESLGGAYYPLSHEVHFHPAHEWNSHSLMCGYARYLIYGEAVFPRIEGVKLVALALDKSNQAVAERIPQWREALSGMVLDRRDPADAKTILEMVADKDFKSAKSLIDLASTDHLRVILLHELMHAANPKFLGTLIQNLVPPPLSKLTHKISGEERKAERLAQQYSNDQRFKNLIKFGKGW